MPHFNHFDFIAPYYDRLIAPTDNIKLAGRLKLPVSGLLLDVGGGTGARSYPFLNMVGGVIIADSSIGMLREVRKKSRLAGFRIESERLAFTDEAFERVIMVDALHHVLDYHETAREIWRVTKVGGRIVIEEPDVRTMAVKFMAAFEKMLLMRSHFINPQGIAASFDYANALIKIDVQDTTAWIMIDKQAN